jgi:hypothetical protein
MNDVPETEMPVAEVDELRLYVAGQSPKSVTAFANLKRLCEEHLPGRYKIEVVDLLQHPQLAGPATKSWRFPRSCGVCPHRVAKLWATSPTPSAPWWGCNCGPRNKTER